MRMTRVVVVVVVVVSSNSCTEMLEASHLSDQMKQATNILKNDFESKNEVLRGENMELRRVNERRERHEGEGE